MSSGRLTMAGRPMGVPYMRNRTPNLLKGGDPAAPSGTATLL